MKRPCLVYLCSAIDEVTCSERNINSDSPAATKKVLEVSKALRRAGVPVVVLSLGRGSLAGTGRCYPAKVKRVDGVPFIYASFLDRPWVTYLWTLFSVPPLTWRLRRHRAPALLAYNRLVHYWPAIEAARFLRFRLFLDLEDGDVYSSGWSWRGWLARAMRYRINRLCGAGAMLAASSLAAQYPKPRVITCYGVASPAAALPRDFSGTAELIVHIGGSLQEDTGADLLAAAVRCLRTLPDPPRMRLVVTGGGESASELERLATEPGLPKVDFLGKVSRAKYLEVLSGAHVGLALKLKLGPLSDTTFPSKVIEITSMGLLLVSTRVSDVPALFGEDGVIYVEDETPAGLAEILQRISNDRLPLREIALRGQRQVQELCSEARVGKALKNFFFDDIQHGSDCRSSGM